MRSTVLCAISAALAAATTLVVLAGCTTLEPHYHRPALPVPAAWPIPATTPAPQAPASVPAASAGATGDSPRAVDIGWRDFFADPQLQRIIAAALANNRDLRVAVLDIQQAHAQYVVQRSQSLPQFDANGGYTKEKLSAAEFGFPVTTAYYSAEAALSSFELDLFGRIRSLNHAALQQYFAQSEARRATQLSLIAQVSQQYLTLLSDRQLLKLAQDTLQSQQDSYNITVKEHDRGQVSGLDVAQAETTVESARSDVARYEGNIAQDTDALTLLVGAPVDTAQVPQALNDKTFGIEALPAELPSEVLLRRPDVLEAEHSLLAANADIGAARAAFFPAISLTGNAGGVSDDFAKLFVPGSSTWAYSPQVTLPLFHGGQLFGGLSEAHVNRDIAVAQYEKAIQTAFREVADALALTDTLRREVEAQQALVGATGRAYQLSQQRYKAGRDSYLDVLDSQRSYYSAQQTFIAAQLAQQDNRVTLYKALGGGWRETTR
ncbi:MAG TPA: efflux transporter outer membrane subunit [Steroidobacteraceae bacterium]|jgi:multidrug efflux system outer membrane protein|nr:efflux transporter outer membrane subunit [Steroidobacteraceae bacterium]